MLRATTACTFFDISTSKSTPRMLSFVHFDLEMCCAPQRRALFQHLNFQKWSEPVTLFTLLSWKCASRHSGVRIFNISAFKSGPNLVCFVHFDLEMCFAARATTACNVSSLILPAVSAPAALASLLFDPPEPHIIRKTQ